jgi:phenylalanyl-tRNA synthetase alpha chain
MRERINSLIQELDTFQPASVAETEEFRIRLLGKKGILTGLFEEFKRIDPARKKEFGKQLNLIKNKALETINAHKERLAHSDTGQHVTDDLTKPADILNTGSRHPISIVQREILDIFRKMGFTVQEGPEIEDDWHVFSALNFPADHPARDMQDTFFINNGSDNPVLLRTHTTRYRSGHGKTKTPIRVVCPGRCFATRLSRQGPIAFSPGGRFVYRRKCFLLQISSRRFCFLRGKCSEPRQRSVASSYFPFTEPSARSM